MSGKHAGGVTVVHRRVEMTVARETITVFRQANDSGRAEQNRCACCGQQMPVEKHHVEKNRQD